MPKGSKKRRAAKRKKEEELQKILDSRVATISEDAIDNSNFSKDANLGDHPVVAASTIVDDGEAISDELNVLPSVGTKTSSSFFLDLKKEETQGYLVANDDDPMIYHAAEGENCAKESEVGLTSNQDSANVFSKNSSEDAVHDVDAPVDILHESVEKGNGDTYVEMNDDAPFDSQTTALSRSDKGSPVQEKGDATLTDHMASEAREDSLWQDDGALQASHNRLVGILSHKEIGVEDKNIGHDRKTLAVSEQDDILKTAIEEVLDTTNKLRELLIKLLHGLDTIQPMEVA
ncbi:unnamed protein product [Coffea canephora]|uniref:Uncharacterized protein n=1 Tax=Coffea canephora TaxID=49390 RepID=A0A068UIS8_COFCA|nr:unnamed protein product [Coffea canephora]